MPTSREATIKPHPTTNNKSMIHQPQSARGKLTYNGLTLNSNETQNQLGKRHTSTHSQLTNVDK